MKGTSCAKPVKTYHYIKYQCPEIVSMMLQDLLHVEGFTEVDIAYGANLSIETVRKYLFKRHTDVAPKDLMALLDFFSRLFYRHKL